MDGQRRLATRHVLQTLAVHKALALLRMYLIDPKLAPTAVEEAVRELEIAAEPARVVPTKALPGESASPNQREWRLQNQDKIDGYRDKHNREAKIQRRMAAGMTREMAEIHADSGSRLSPRGYDMDAEGYNPELDLAEEDEFPPVPTVDIQDLRGGKHG